MKIMKKTRIILIACAFSLALLAAGFLFLYENIKNLEAQRPAIVQAIKTALNRDVQYDRAEFSLWTGPTFTFTGVVIRERDGEASFVSVERLAVTIAVVPLLRKELVIRDLQFFRPRAAIWRDDSGIWNVGDLFAPGRDMPIDVRRLTVKDGRIDFQDRFERPEAVNLTLQDLNVTWRGLGKARKSQLDLQTAVMRGVKAGRFEAAGSVTMPAAGRPWTESAFDMRLRARGIDLTAYEPYFHAHVPCEVTKAALDGDIVFKGTVPAFSSAGNIVLNGLSVRYSAAFPSVLAPAQVRLDYDMERGPDNLSAKKLNVSIDDFRAYGSISLKEIGTKDPFIEARVKTDEFSFVKHQSYVPYNLIPENVTAYMRDHIRDGLFRLNEGNLVGRLSQLRNLNQGNNAHVLSARLGVTKGVMTYGAAVPLLREIRGELVFRGADFLLQGMSGYFGDSPISLNGAIRNYCLDTPSTYPFQMTVQAGENEMVWLMGPEIMQKAKIKGPSHWKLSGEGPLDRYTLTGEGDLTATAYTYGPLTKAAGMPNRLKFIADSGPGVMTVRSWQYDAPSVSLSGTARHRSGRQEQTLLTVRSTAFDLKNLIPLLPSLGKYGIAGEARIQLQGERKSQRGKDFQWRGEMVLENGSVSALDGMKPFHHIRGVIRLADHAVTTTGLTFGIGSAELRLQGQLRDFDHPVVEATVASKSLDLAEVGLTDTPGVIQFRNFNGRMTMKGGTTDSSRNIWPVRGNITAGQGRMGGQDVTNLRADLAYQGRKLGVNALNFGALGGQFSGTGTVDLTDRNKPVYDFDFRIVAVPAASFLRTMDISPQKISGSVSIKGRLRASGTKKEDLSKTLTGKMAVEIERGVLKQFAVLSKIFSLLNVSQLFKLQLPDMASDGMPFRNIKASLDIKDGVIASEDCFVRSDAMNMIVVGKIDIIRKTMDVTIGLQPLQTIDKVVSRVPILGWVLTDEDKRLITVLFEAKGGWEEPAVRSLAAQEMAKGVFHIFMRALQLPVKLITDMGEVVK